jgi:hypothetical protein
MALTRAQKAAKAAAAAARAAETPEAVTEQAAPAASPTGPKVKPRDDSSELGSKIRAPVVHDKAQAGENTRTVVAVCKMPRGLLLQHTEMVDQDVRVVGGGIEKRKVAMRIGEPVRLRPCVLPFGTVPNYPIVEGFSLTHVDSNFWRTWYEQNRNFSMLSEGLLCAFDTEADARAYCQEYGKLKHGLEPLLQSGDPRTEQPNHPNVTDLDIDTDAPKARN